MAYVPRDIGTRIALGIGGEITRPLAERIAARAKANIAAVVKDGKVSHDIDVSVKYMGADHVVIASVKTVDRKKPENNGKEIMSFLEYGFHSSVWGTYPPGSGPWVDGQHPMRNAALGG